jgi:hypothetical protein
MSATGNVLLSAGLAGLVAIGATVAIERLGGRRGGLLSTLPTTIVPAALGLAAELDDPAFRAAMYTTPAGMLVNAAFLWSWRALPPRLRTASLRLRLGLMVTVSLGIWATAASLSFVVLTRVPEVLLAAQACVLSAALFGVGVLANRRAPPAPKGDNRVAPVVLLARGLLAALAIGLSVGLASVGGPFLAGLAAVFPAIFLTTMVSLWMSQGEAVQVGAVGPMMLGSGSVSFYAVFAAWALPTLGSVPGAAVAWLAAVVLVTMPAWWWLQRGASRTDG